MPKISVLTVTYILTVLVCFSQNEISFEKGEIKTKSGNIISCYVGLKVTNGNFIRYKLDNDPAEHIIGLSEIKMVITPYNIYENILLDGTEYLMRRIVGGSTKLYNYVENNINRVVHGDGGTYQFYSPKITYAIQKNGVYIELKKKNFESILISLMADCPDVLSKLESKKYEFENLESIVSQYNYCVSDGDRKILGRILDKDTQKAIKNASIHIKDSDISASTNYLGFFELEIDPRKHTDLIISHIGYKTYQLIIPDEDKFMFSLEKEFLPLPELSLKANDAVYLNSSTKIATSNESPAYFSGGLNQIYSYWKNLLADLSFPDKLKNFKILFTIDSSGALKNTSIEGLDKEMESKVEFIFSNTPLWTPAQQFGTKVEQHFKLVVNITPSNLDIPDSISIYKYFGNNLKYPAPARRMGIEGQVYVKFELDPEGQVLSIVPLKDIGFGCKEDVVDVTMKMPVEIGKELLDLTGYNQFILPVAYGLDKPFISDNKMKELNSFTLNTIYITAIGVERTTPKYATPRVSQNLPPINFPYSSIADAEKNSDRVHNLTLPNNGLEYFPKEVLKFQNLEFLNLEQNKIKTLPSEIGALSKLKELYLFNNQIEVLPIEINSLKKIIILSLASNRLKSFPIKNNSFEKLEVLDLSDNQLTEIPENISSMKNLRILAIQNNSIRSIPVELYKLEKLKQLHLHGNPLDSKTIEQLKSSFRKTKIVF